jgi:hypothetical protein
MTSPLTSVRRKSRPLKPCMVARLQRLRAAGVGDTQQRAQLDLLRALNEEHQARHPAEADLAARIQSYELAYRIQTAAPEALDVSRETSAIQSLYGLDRRDSTMLGSKSSVVEFSAGVGSSCWVARS